MDSLTHLALGAVTGELMLGHKLGKRAMVFGALANSFPDIDFIAALWLNPADNLLVHRGFTHSFLCIAILSIFFAWLAMRYYKIKKLSTQTWLLFIGAQLALHLIVDAFNAYGVGWFIPFSSVRISFNTLFVADPFYSGWLIAAALILFAYRRLDDAMRVKLAQWAFLLSSAYLAYAVGNKLFIEYEVKTLLKKQGITYNRHFTTPTPLNTWLWFVVAEADSGYHIGYRSVFDDRDSLTLTFVPRNENFLDGWETDREVLKLKQFSQGYYTLEHHADTLVFNDLRFGQMAGWRNPEAGFAFHYYLNYPDDNRTVMQRGRFAKWDETTVKALLSRIRGNESTPAVENKM